jgi:hypothetical protein
MCDYSLQGLPNRLAVEGEELVTHRFSTGSIGLASPADVAAARRPQLEPAARRSWWSALKSWLAPPCEVAQAPAVCIPPGTQLLMSRIPESLRREFALNAVEDVTFTQLSAEAFQYRDAIRFANGRQLVLQSFREGVCFGVLSLAPNEPETASELRESQAREQAKYESRGGLWLIRS